MMYSRPCVSFSMGLLRTMIGERVAGMFHRLDDTLSIQQAQKRVQELCDVFPLYP